MNSEYLALLPRAKATLSGAIPDRRSRNDAGSPNPMYWPDSHSGVYVLDQIDDMDFTAGHGSEPVSWTDIPLGWGWPSPEVDANSEDLKAALGELAQIENEARDLGVSTPDESTKKNAACLLRSLHTLFPGRYDVSPTDRGGVAIAAPSRRGAAVVVECAPLGRVYCFVTVDGNRRRAKYYQMDGLPDEFIIKAMCDLRG